MTFAMAFPGNGSLPAKENLPWETCSTGTASGFRSSSTPCLPRGDTPPGTSGNGKKSRHSTRPSSRSRSQTGSRCGTQTGGSRCGTSGWPSPSRCGTGTSGYPAPVPSGSSTAGTGTSKVPKMLPLRTDVLLSNTLFEELDGGITEEYLRLFTSKDNLDEVDFLEMQVDAVSGAQQVECLGEFMPNLEQLRLNQSAVCTIRDLGTNYAQLRVLWLCRSALQDLGGITAMPVLEELYISFNDVRDLSPLYTHDTLQVLDVEGNQIEDFDDVASLQTVISLRELTLNSNPVCKSETFSRAVVFEALPQLQVLDDILRGEEAPAQLQDLEVEDADVDAAFLAGLKDEMEQDGTDPTTSGSDKEGQDPGELRGLASIGQLLDEDELAEQAEGSDAVAELRKSWAILRAAASSGGSPVKAPSDELLEPSEQELVVENLKRARKPVPNVGAWQTMSARPSQQNRPGTGFFPDRRMKTAWSGSQCSTSYRPPSSGGGSFTSFSTVPSSSTVYSGAEDLDPNASDLTMGDGGSVLAGNALSAIRRRRKLAKERGEDEHSIRDMLRKFETYRQESCLSEAELESRRRQFDRAELDMKRPGTSDVRVSAPRLLTASGRPAAFPTSLPGAPGESWVPRKSTDGAKRPSSRGDSRRTPDFPDSSFYAPTFSTENGEALIIN